LASGLAARIKDIFGITPQLVEGHNGIYKVAINGRVVATNKGKCSGIPTAEELLLEIRKHRSPLPGRERMVKPVIPLMKG
jgi:hypothetical protein